jgi:calpain-15
MTEDMTFWMSYLEAVSYFKSLNVCRVQNWNEIRIKGKFLRVQDIEQPSIEVVLSKWYYQVEVKDQPARIFIGLHQEDERIKGVLLRRPYMDVSLAVLKCTTEGVELVDLKDFMQDR